MAGLAERLKARRMISTVLRVPYPTEAPEVILDLARLTPAQMRKIQIDILWSGQGSTDAAKDGVVAGAELLLHNIKRATWPDGGELDAQQVRDFADSLGGIEAIALWAAYNRAVEADEEAAKKKAI